MYYIIVFYSTYMRQWRHGDDCCDVDSLSSGDDHHLDKMTDIEKLLANTQADKLRLMEQQVRWRHAAWVVKRDA